MLTKKPLINKSDCALEHHIPELLSLFTEYGVMVQFFENILGRGLRRMLLQIGLPLSMWGAAVILITDIYNACLQSSQDNDIFSLHGAPARLLIHLFATRGGACQTSHSSDFWL